MGRFFHNLAYISGESEFFFTDVSVDKEVQLNCGGNADPESAYGLQIQILLGGRTRSLTALVFTVFIITRDVNKFQNPRPKTNIPADYRHLICHHSTLCHSRLKLVSQSFPPSTLSHPQ